MNELAGKVALVTGASGGIGSHVCRGLADSGARVIQQYRSRPVAVGDLPGEGHVAAAVDFTAPAWEADLSEVVEEVGGVDILINAAHPAKGSANVSDLDPEVLAAHLSGALLHARLAALVLPAMRCRNWGRIVYVSGALMARPWPGMGAYAAAKAAGSVLTRHLALEEGRHGITANIVAPGRVVDPSTPEPELDERWRALEQALLEKTALGRFPSTLDVADAILSLVQPAAGAITGQTVWVTGGEPIN